MRRTYSIRRNALLSRTGPRLGLAALVIAIFIALLRLLLPGVFLWTARPFFSFSNYLDTRSSAFFSGFDSASALAAERDQLVEQNQTLSQENATLSAKVADLESLVGTTPAMPTGVVAGILARPPEAPYDVLILAAGSDEDIQVGDVGYADGELPIGMITAVAGESARLTLLSAPDMASDAWVGNDRLPITLYGEGSGTFSAEAPRAASTTVGEAVYVAGPGALPIGSVQNIGGDPSSPYLTLAIAGIVNPFSLTQVVIRHEGPGTWPTAPPSATTTPPL